MKVNAPDESTATVFTAAFVFHPSNTLTDTPELGHVVPDGATTRPEMDNPVGADRVPDGGGEESVGVGVGVGVCVGVGSVSAVGGADVAGDVDGVTTGADDTRVVGAVVGAGVAVGCAGTGALDAGDGVVAALATGSVAASAAPGAPLMSVATTTVVSATDRKVRTRARTVVTVGPPGIARSHLVEAPGGHANLGSLLPCGPCGVHASENGGRTTPGGKIWRG